MSEMSSLSGLVQFLCGVQIQIRSDDVGLPELVNLQVKIIKCIWTTARAPAKKFPSGYIKYFLN